MRSSMLLAAAVAALLAVQASAHVCMWHPMQRDGMSIAGPAENPCYRKVGPCGTDKVGPVTQLPAGRTYTVEFQQNANHYYTGKPGQLVIDWAEGSQPAESDFHPLTSIDDYNAMGELTQTNFSRTINVPEQPCDACVLRVRYVSNNPLEDPQGHGPTFYQCADVSFVSGAAADAVAATEPEAPVATPAPAASDATNACCAPSSFTTSFVMQKPMTSSKGTIYYDNANHMMREDVVHGDGTGTTATNGRFTIISNFTSGDGYYLNLVTGKCMLGGPFGLDLWNEWCFGSAMESETYTNDGDCPAPGTGSCHFYANGDWTFGATTEQCFPASIIGKPNSGNFADVTYFGGKSGPISSSMWTPPAACVTAKAAAVAAAAGKPAARATQEVAAEVAEGSLTALLMARMRGEL